MNDRRPTHGFTLLELMIVLAIVGAMVAIALPGLTRYQQTETAKSGALRVAQALREARVRAMKEGIPYLVYLNPDTGADPPIAPLFPDQTVQRTVARIVRDSNDDQAESLGDNLAINVNVETDSLGVRAYRPGTDPYDAVAEPGMVQPAVDDVLGALVEGSSFPLSPAGAPATIAAFNSRGLPVRWTAPDTPGQGLGGYYVTDGNGNVFAAVMGPLGEVRVLSWGAGSTAWR